MTQITTSRKIAIATVIRKFSPHRITAVIVLGVALAGAPKVKSQGSHLLMAGANTIAADAVDVDNASIPIPVPVNLYHSSEVSHAEWDINDSLENIPAYDLYCDFTSAHVHPYDFDLTNMKDTVSIPLVKSGNCDFHMPVDGRITSNFGQRRYEYHLGVDLHLNTGDPVYAAFEGIVRVAHYDRSYGNVVVIRHPGGLETLYAHMSRLKVQPGDWVQAGQEVGLGGSTGHSTGSHLHFECRYMDEPINPNSIIDFAGDSLKTDTLVVDQSTFAYLKAARARKYCVIRRGDTLSEIAERYRTSVSKLCKINGIRPSTTLHIGHRLRYN